VATKRVNPSRAKLNRSYSVAELATCMGVNSNTVRNWQHGGLAPIDKARPVLFQGAVVRAFLSQRNASRKRPCPPGTLYCFRCREPRRPALGMVDFVPVNRLSGNIRALCDTCETVMHRRARKAALATIVPGCDVQFVEGQLRLKGCSSPSLNCDLERQVVTC
jgi:hypothetical protein